MMIFIAVFLALAILIATFASLFRALASRSVQNACSLEWLDSFSLENYAPMQRLLDKGDVEFLSSQPGYRPEIGKRLMAERRKIFRGYLRLLILDFSQLIGLGKLMVVYAAEDRAELARALWRYQISFYFAVCSVQCRLALHPFGWSTVDVHKLVQALETMRGQIQALASQRMAAAQLA
jgi:hypothetical protein